MPHCINISINPSRQPSIGGGVSIYFKYLNRIELSQSDLLNFRGHLGGWGCGCVEGMHALIHAYTHVKHAKHDIHEGSHLLRCHVLLMISLTSLHGLGLFC